jgi:peptidoglycan/LPS O-acetylase OafA/YrhL
MNTPSASNGNLPLGNHLPSLDGLRAISIALVFIGHVSGTKNLGPLTALSFLGNVGHFGVVIFFVISGFLITRLLIQEHHKTGHVSLTRFYARRALRIFPASYAYIGIMGLLSALGIISLARHDLLFSVLYLVNYKLDRSWFIGHLWSLSVEEQFYLLWPLAFTILGRSKRWAWGAAAFVVLGPVARILGWLFLRHTPYVDLEMFPMVADSLATGCLLAVLRNWLERQELYLRLFHWLPSLVMVVIVLTLNRFMHYTVVNTLGFVLINILLAILIHRSVYCWRDTWGRFLNCKPVRTVGLLSYSLYLWQQPFLDKESNSWIASFPQNILLAISAATLSYLLLEKPLLKLRGRLRSTRGPAAAADSLPTLSVTRS